MALYNATATNKDDSDLNEWHNQPSDGDAVRIGQDK